MAYFHLPSLKFQLTLSDDVLVVELEADGLLKLQMNPRLTIFLLKQMLHSTSTISISQIKKPDGNSKNYANMTCMVLEAKVKDTRCNSNFNKQVTKYAQNKLVYICVCVHTHTR